MNILILLAPLIFIFPKRVKSIAAAVMITIGALINACSSVITLINGSSWLIPEFDVINAPFALAISIVGTAAAIYAVGTTKDIINTKSSTLLSLHFCCLVVLFYSMLGVLKAESVYEFLLWWELMTLSSFVLVIFEASRKQVLHAAISYLLLMHISFFFLLSAFALCDGETMWSNNSIVVWLLFLVGFGLKSALFPLHIWLPVTYLNTPSHVTAMMSGVMINMGIYGIMRVTLASEDMLLTGTILFCVGIVSGVFGIVKAALHTGLKRLLAYSSVENMGIITMAIGLGAIGVATDNHTLLVCGTAGALLHMLNHSAYKSLLFMAAGSLEKATQKSDLNRMGGLLKNMPVTGWVFALGALAICAIPPLSGFFSEYTIFYGLFKIVADGSQPILGICGIIALALIGGLAVLTFSKVFTMVFLGQARSCSVRDASEVDSVTISAYALPLACVLAGGIVFAYMLLKHDEICQTMVMIEAVMAGVILLVAILWILRRALQRGKVIDSQPT